MKDKVDTESITTKIEFFRELEQLDLERETLASNINQVETDMLMSLSQKLFSLRS